MIALIIIFIIFQGCSKPTSGDKHFTNSDTTIGSTVHKDSLSLDQLVQEIVGKSTNEANMMFKTYGIGGSDPILNDEKLIIHAKLYEPKLRFSPIKLSIIEVMCPNSDWTYLVFVSDDQNWSYKGKIDLPHQRTNEPSFHIEESLNGEKVWFVVNKLAGYGTGVYIVKEVWYSIDSEQIKQDLDYIVYMHEWLSESQTVLTKIFAEMKNPKEWPKNLLMDQKLYVDIEYNIEFYDNKAYSLLYVEDHYLFTANRTTRYVWDEDQGEFIVDLENSDGDEAAILDFSKQGLFTNYKHELEQLEMSSISIKQDWLKRLNSIDK